jgi:hypothetical protein
MALSRRARRTTAATAFGDKADIGSRALSATTGQGGQGFNKRKMEEERRLAAEKEAAARLATDAQVLRNPPCTLRDRRQGIKEVVGTALRAFAHPTLASLLRP